MKTQPKNLFCAFITFWYGLLLLLMGCVCLLVGFILFYFTWVCSLKCHPRNWYINCFDSFKIKLGILDFTASLTCLLAKQDYGYSQKGVSGPREMLLLCFKGRIFENYPKLQATQLISTGSWNRCYSKIKDFSHCFSTLTVSLVLYERACKHSLSMKLLLGENQTRFWDIDTQSAHIPKFPYVSPSSTHPKHHESPRRK